VHELSPLIYDLAIMLGLASLVILLFQKIHQPVVLGYLVAGMIVGPHTPPYSLVSDIKDIRVLSELGVIFLMFSLGLEFSFRKLARVGFSATVTGVIEVLLMVVIGHSVGMALGWQFYDSLFLGAALAISSTTIIIKAIDELKLKTKRFAEIIFGVLIVEDLLAILILVALQTLVATQNILSMSMLFAWIKLILVVGGWFIIGYFLVPPWFLKISKYINQETLTILSVALCLIFVSIAASFHYGPALGAFIIGSILAETVLIRRIEDLIKPICDIFAAVFFISVGMLIDPLVIVKNWQVVLLISIVTIFGKLITTSVAAFLTGQSANTSLRVGFSMAQVGEFSFIIVGLGLALGVVSNELYPLIVAVSGITTFTTPYLIRLSGKFEQMLDNMPPRAKFFLDSYSSWVYRTQIISSKNPLIQTISYRLLINGILIAIIFALVNDILVRRFNKIVFEANWANNMLFLFVALMLASPFIWGMLFSYKKRKLGAFTKEILTPLILMIWLITLTEVAVLSIFYFKTWATLIFILGIAAIFFIVSYTQLERSYQWFERQFLSSLKNKTEGKKSRFEELAPWDTHLVEMTVTDNSHFAGKTLRESKVRQNYGVNIVAIAHGLKIIPAPRGNEKIMPDDKLIVLGNDEQIDAFRKDVEIENIEDEGPQSFLTNFMLMPLLLEGDNPLIGKSIRHSRIREMVGGLIVGLERNNRRILNPDPNTALRKDDLLLIVGETNKMEKWSKV
jgi:CPA2 family monovalent cation:H+ antiporter-2